MNVLRAIEKGFVTMSDIRPSLAMKRSYDIAKCSLQPDNRPLRSITTMLSDLLSRAGYKVPAKAGSLLHHLPRSIRFFYIRLSISQLSTDLPNRSQRYTIHPNTSRHLTDLRNRRTWHPVRALAEGPRAEVRMSPATSPAAPTIPWTTVS